MTDKKIPTRVQDFLTLSGALMGLSIGGFIVVMGFVLGGFKTSLIVWGLVQALCILVLALIRWRYDELLKEWGVVKEKEEKKRG